MIDTEASTLNHRAESWWFYGAPPLSSYQDLAPFVYYIQCGAFVKIGTSIDPEKRCDQLRRGGKARRPSIWVGDPVLLGYHRGSAHDERGLHHHFSKSRDLGEWFRVTEELHEHVSDVAFEQAVLEIAIHDGHYKDWCAGQGIEATAVDIGEVLKKQTASRPQLDTEWLELFEETA